MSVSLGQQGFSIDNKGVPAGFDFKLDSSYDKIEPLYIQKNSTVLQMHHNSLDSYSLQNSQHIQHPTVPLIVGHVPLGQSLLLLEDNLYVYAPPSVSAPHYPLGSSFSTPESNSVTQTPNNVAANYNANAQYLNPNPHSTGYSEAYAEASNKKSSESNLPQLDSYMRVTRCTCKLKTKRIPRPRNAFILFRQKYHQSVFGDSPGRTLNSEISRELGNRWRNLSPEEREHWNELAKEEKINHAKKYPDYRYTPRRNGKKDCDFCKSKTLQDFKTHDGNHAISPNTPSGLPISSGLPTHQVSSQDPILLQQSQQLQQSRKMQKTPQYRQLAPQVHLALVQGSLLSQVQPDNQMNSHHSFPTNYNLLAQMNLYGGQNSVYNQMGQIGQMTAMGHVGQMGQIGQLGQMGQVGQVGQLNQPNHSNLANQINIGPMNQINQMGHLGMGQMGQMASIDSLSQMGQGVQMNPMLQNLQSNYHDGSMSNSVMMNPSMQPGVLNQSGPSTNGTANNEKSYQYYDRMYQQPGDQLLAEQFQIFDSSRATGGQYNTFTNSNNPIPKQYSLQPLGK